MQGLFALGDSKTDGDAWVGLLSTELSSQTSWSEITPRFGVSGGTAATVKTYVDSNLSSVVGTANIITINLGANDVGSLPAEATWKANLTSIVDSLRAKWSLAHIYIARAWRRSFATECNTLATWINDVIGTYPTHVHLGMDERVWLENGDDGVTYTTDGVHYTAGAQSVCAQEWMTAIDS